MQIPELIVRSNLVLLLILNPIQSSRVSLKYIFPMSPESLVEANMVMDVGFNGMCVSLNYIL